MNFAEYTSPLGEIRSFFDGDALAGLYFVGQKYEREVIASDTRLDARDSRRSGVARWLDAYFAGDSADYAGPLTPRGTPFQQAVWQRLLRIPHGQTSSYGALARAVGPTQAARAVGAAVGRNPVSLIIPCHRVLGASGSLTGYAGGITRKQALLQLEQGGDLLCCAQ
jgi:methylated-DNA-[protein]-cysteine S-methyltransferase